MLWSTTWLNNLLASMSSGAAAMMPSGSGVQSVEALFLLLLLFVALFAGLARRLRVPYPILLVIAGLVLSFLPGMPRVDLNPDVVFLVFLPPSR
jgi:CPA1 family monovalent cation:H+ antiporter